jgi:co-chaperonin GroES (HSP10)
MSARNLNVVELSQAQDFKTTVLEKLGDLSRYEVLGSNVLLATYIEPEKTAGGIIRPQRNVEEARWQGKVGLILKLGPTAFQYDGPYEWPATARKPSVGDWVMHHASEARELSIKSTSCKIIDSTLIRLVVPNPADIY